MFLILAQGKTETKLYDGRPKAITPFCGFLATCHIPEFGFGLFVDEERYFKSLLPANLIMGLRAIMFIQSLPEIEDGVISQTIDVTDPRVRLDRLTIEKLKEFWPSAEEVKDFVQGIRSWCPSSEEIDECMFLALQHGLAVNCEGVLELVSKDAIPTSPLIEQMVVFEKEYTQQMHVIRQSHNRQIYDDLPWEESLSALLRNLGVEEVLFENDLRRFIFMEKLDFVVRNRTNPCGPVTDSVQLKQAVNDQGDRKARWITYTYAGDEYLLRSAKFFEGKIWVETHIQDQEGRWHSDWYTVPQLREMLDIL